MRDIVKRGLLLSCILTLGVSRRAAATRIALSGRK
jgi:hypothetical protein